MINLKIKIVSSMFVATVLMLSLVIPVKSYASGNELRDINLIDFTNDHMLVKPVDLKNTYLENYIKEYNNEQQNSEIISFDDLGYNTIENQYEQDLSSTGMYLISTPIPFLK